MTLEPSVIVLATGAGAIGGFVASRVRRPGWRVAGHRPDPLSTIRFLAPARHVTIRPLPKLVVTLDQPAPIAASRTLPPPVLRSSLRSPWMPPVVAATPARARTCHACSKTLREIDHFCSDCGLAVGQQR